MPSCADSLAALIRGEPLAWDALALESPRLIALCAEEGLTGLVHERARRLPPDCGWPAGTLADLARAAHAGTAAEMVRGAEIRDTLAGLTAAGIRPVLFKGTSLAYSVYDEPGSRPRGDTDMLVRETDVDAARRALAARGYRATVYCDDLFSQFEVQRTGDFGVTHVFDVHWKISTQPAFANLLTYDEMDGAAADVPALGPHARTAGPLHALLLACVHPVMHHQNVERLLWIYDLHLLASRLSPAEFDAFADLARRKAMAAVCAQQLARAQQRFGTAIPPSTLGRLSSRRGREPSSAYLGADRRWHHELRSILGALPGWSSRARHLRGVLFPSPQYVLGAYGLPQTPLRLLLLPALYVHRNLVGAWKILLGRK